MKKIWVLIFFLGTTMEVRVKASEAHHGTEHSSSHNEPAPDQKEERAPRMRIEKHAQSPFYFEILHGKNALIEKGTLFSGGNWIRKTKSYKLKTPYGEIHSQSGDFFVHYEFNKVRIVNHLGKLTIQLRDGSSLELLPGFEVWISEMQENKKNRVGVIQPVELKEYVNTLGRLWDEDPLDLKEELLKFQSRWGDRTGLAAHYYKGLAQRKIASAEQVEDRIQSNKLREKLRRQANRKLLFERTFGR